MQNFFMILVVSIIAESVWETLKMVWQNGKVSIDRIGALVVSISITIGTRMDIFSYFGIDTTIPFMGIILTGVLISRGSNFVHDLLEKLSKSIK